MSSTVPADIEAIIQQVSTNIPGQQQLRDTYNFLTALNRDGILDASANEIFKISIHDDYGLKSELTPLYEMRVSNTHRLAGGTFVGTTPDANIYSTALTGSATSTIAGRLMTLATGTTSNSTGRIETVVTGQYTASNANFSRFVLSVGDTGVTNNIRRWGATTTTNGFFFYLKGTEFGVGVRKNGVETYTPLASFNGDKTFVLDTNLHIYEIYYKSSGAYFVIDEKLVHTMHVTNVPLVADFNLKPAITNENSNNLATNHIINCTLMTVSRFGELTTNPFYKNLVGAGTYTLKQSAGRLHSIICNNAANTTGQSITIYDNTAGSGTKIGTLDLSKLPSPMAIQYNSNGVAYSTGLTLVIVGSAVDTTVIYE